MEEQSDQLEKLKRELAAKAGELAHAQEALSRTEQVRAAGTSWVLFPVNWAIFTRQWAPKQARCLLDCRELSVSWEWCGTKTGAVNTGKARQGWYGCWPSSCSQSGSELSARLDTLNAEKEALTGAMRQREAELLAAQSLVREKEEALSQEQQRSSQEKGELQGRLEEKVWPPSALPHCEAHPLV